MNRRAALVVVGPAVDPGGGDRNGHRDRGRTPPQQLDRAEEAEMVALVKIRVQNRRNSL